MKVHALVSSLSVALLPTVTLSDNANTCDVVDQGTSFDPRKDDCDIYIMHPSFLPMLKGTTGINVRLESLPNATGSDDDQPEKIFHEGPVLFDDALYFTSNRLGKDQNAQPSWGQTSQPRLDQYIKVMKLDLETNELHVLETNPYIQMANGMTKTADGENILVCSQGFNTTGATILELDRKNLETKPVLTSFFGKQFNSLNDIEITVDGIIFLSDPPYGFEQGFRSYENPSLGSNVYRYDTTTKRLTLLTTDFQRPNGVALFDDRRNSNGCTLFLSDSGFETAPFKGEDVQMPRGLDGVGDSTIYILKDKGDGCFSPKDGPWPRQPLTPSTVGIQDGMEVHQSAGLLFYCDGSGLWIYSISLNQLFGFVKLPSGCTQVMFPQKIGNNDVFILAETKLYEISLNFQDAKEMTNDDSSGSFTPPYGTTFVLCSLLLFFLML